MTSYVSQGKPLQDEPELTTLLAPFVCLGLSTTGRAVAEKLGAEYILMEAMCMFFIDKIEGQWVDDRNPYMAPCDVEARRTTVAQAARAALETEAKNIAIGCAWAIEQLVSRNDAVRFGVGAMVTLAGEMTAEGNVDNMCAATMKANIKAQVHDAACSMLLVSTMESQMHTGAAAKDFQRIFPVSYRYAMARAMVTKFGKFKVPDVVVSRCFPRRRVRAFDWSHFSGDFADKFRIRVAPWTVAFPTVDIFWIADNWYFELKQKSTLIVVHDDNYGELWRTVSGLLAVMERCALAALSARASLTSIASNATGVIAMIMAACSDDTKAPEIAGAIKNLFMALFIAGHPELETLPGFAEFNVNHAAEIIKEATEKHEIVADILDMPGFLELPMVQQLDVIGVYSLLPVAPANGEKIIERVSTMESKVKVPDEEAWDTFCNDCRLRRIINRASEEGILVPSMLEGDEDAKALACIEFNKWFMDKKGAQFSLPAELSGKIRLRSYIPFTDIGNSWPAFAKNATDLTVKFGRVVRRNEYVAALEDGAAISLAGGEARFLTDLVVDKAYEGEVFRADVDNKAESTKPPQKVRVTATAERFAKWVLSTMEYNMKKNVKCCSSTLQTADESETSGVHRRLNSAITAAATTLMIFQDIVAWSESQNRSTLFKHAKVDFELFEGDVASAYAEAHDYVWNHLRLVYDRSGTLVDVEWKNSTMQGMRGFADSKFHGDVCAAIWRRLIAAFPELGTGRQVNLTNIDDVLMAVTNVCTTSAEWGVEKVTKVFDTVAETYATLGMEVDPNKSGLSTVRYVILSRWFLNGVELGMSMRTECKSAYSHRNDYPSLHSMVAARFNARAAIATQNTSPSEQYTIAVIEVACLMGVMANSALAANPALAGVTAFLPRALGGLAVPFPTSWLSGSNEAPLATLFDVINAAATRLSATLSAADPVSSPHSASAGTVFALVADDVMPAAKAVMTVLNEIEPRVLDPESFAEWVLSGSVCSLPLPQAGEDVYTSELKRALKGIKKHATMKSFADPELLAELSAAAVSACSCATYPLPLVAAVVDAGVLGILERHLQKGLAAAKRSLNRITTSRLLMQASKADETFAAASLKLFAAKLGEESGAATHADGMTFVTTMLNGAAFSLGLLFSNVTLASPTCALSIGGGCSHDRGVHVHPFKMQVAFPTDNWLDLRAPPGPLAGIETVNPHAPSVVLPEAATGDDRVLKRALVLLASEAHRGTDVGPLVALLGLLRHFPSSADLARAIPFKAVGSRKFDLAQTHQTFLRTGPFRNVISAVSVDLRQTFKDAVPQFNLHNYATILSYLATAALLSFDLGWRLTTADEPVHWVVEIRPDRVHLEEDVILLRSAEARADAASTIQDVAIRASAVLPHASTHTCTFADHIKSSKEMAHDPPALEDDDVLDPNALIVPKYDGPFSGLLGATRLSRGMRSTTRDWQVFGVDASETVHGAHMLAKVLQSCRDAVAGAGSGSAMAATQGLADFTALEMRKVVIPRIAPIMAAPHTPVEMMHLRRAAAELFSLDLDAVITSVAALASDPTLIDENVLDEDLENLLAQIWYLIAMFPKATVTPKELMPVLLHAEDDEGRLICTRAWAKVSRNVAARLRVSFMQGAVERLVPRYLGVAHATFDGNALTIDFPATLESVYAAVSEAVARRAEAVTLWDYEEFSELASRAKTPADAIYACTMLQHRSEGAGLDVDAGVFASQVLGRALIIMSDVFAIRPPFIVKSMVAASADMLHAIPLDDEDAEEAAHGGASLDDQLAHAMGFSSADAMNAALSTRTSARSGFTADNLSEGAASGMLDFGAKSAHDEPASIIDRMMAAQPTRECVRANIASLAASLSDLGLGGLITTSLSTAFADAEEVLEDATLGLASERASLTRAGGKRRRLGGASSTPGAATGAAVVPADRIV